MLLPLLPSESKAEVILGIACFHYYLYFEGIISLHYLQLHPGGF